jgi:hypothetical protein
MTNAFLLLGCFDMLLVQVCLSVLVCSLFFPPSELAAPCNKWRHLKAQTVSLCPQCQNQ